MTALMDVLADAQGGQFFANAGAAAGIGASEARSAMEALCPAIAAAKSFLPKQRRRRYSSSYRSTRRRKTTRRPKTPSLEDIFGSILGGNKQQ